MSIHPLKRHVTPAALLLGVVATAVLGRETFDWRRYALKRPHERGTFLVSVFFVAWLASLLALVAKDPVAPVSAAVFASATLGFASALAYERETGQEVAVVGMAVAAGSCLLALLWAW